MPAALTAPRVRNRSSSTSRAGGRCGEGLTIAAAIGMHNFAEGLAIGVSARAGAISLATVLIIGFALHNATEGFGIVGPLGDVTPSWKWLGLAGLIGGGPTFVGSMVGYAVTSDPLELVFYALAGGRDPVRDRRGLERDAALWPPRAGADDARRGVHGRRADGSDRHLRRGLIPSNARYMLRAG